MQDIILVVIIIILVLHEACCYWYQSELPRNLHRTRSLRMDMVAAAPLLCRAASARPQGSA